MKKFRKILLVFSLLVACLFSIVSPSVNNIVFASVDTDAVVYTDVMDDLQKDVNFNSNEYIENSSDYSLQVIQVAESENGELFIYVFQPCSPNNDLTATSINISTGIGQNLSYHNYKLQLLNAKNGFGKYKVRNFQVSNNTTRYYDISTIFRKWFEIYDESLPQENENIITEVSFAVGKQFAFTTTANGVSVDCKDVELIRITSKYVGFCRYYGRTALPIFNGNSNVDAHFVAFSTDKRIDKLMQADVYYTSQTRQQRVSLGFIDNTSYGNIEEHYTTLNYTDVVNATPSSEMMGTIGERTYTWNRIQSVDDFIETEDREYIYNGVIFNSSTEVKITDEGLQDLQGKEWVLRFVETEYYQEVEGMGLLSPYVERSTIIGNVSILRLAFETDGVYYNLGVIDNKQSGDGIPDNYTKTEMSLTDLGKLILGILMLIIILIVFAPILPTLFTIIWAVIKFIIKIIIKIISLPFKIFKQKK